MIAFEGIKRALSIGFDWKDPENLSSSCGFSLEPTSFDGLAETARACVEKRLAATALILAESVLDMESTGYQSVLTLVD